MGASGTASLPLGWRCPHNTPSGPLVAGWTAPRTVETGVPRGNVDQTPDSGRRSSSDGDSWPTVGKLWAVASFHRRQLAAGTLHPGPNHAVMKLRGDTARPPASVVEHVALTVCLTYTAV